MKTLFVIAAATLSCAPVAAATVTNGSMTGPEAAFRAPAGWTITGTPDTRSADDTGGAFLANPGVSPDGGTWAMLGSEGRSFTEGLSQTVSDFIVGATYEVSWYISNPGCCASVAVANYDATNRISFLLDGSVVYGGTSIPLGTGWLRESYGFTATSTSTRIGFLLGSGVRSYLALDGVTISEVSDVPAPAAPLLLFAGVAGMIVVRQRQRRTASS